MLTINRIRTGFDLGLHLECCDAGHAKIRWFKIAIFVALMTVFAEPRRAAADEAGTPAAVAEPAPGGASHPLVGRVAALIEALDARGIALESDAGGAALAECVARAADPSARVFTADRYAQFRGEQEGWAYHTGYRFTMKNGVPYIADVPADGASALQVGDEVTRIDGEPTTNLTMDAVLARTRGHSATTLALTVRRDGVAITAGVARTRAMLPPVEAVEVWPREIGYMRVNGLFRAHTGAVAALLREWGAKKLAGGILDLRGAGGDDIEGAAALAAPFASPGSLLFSIRDRDDHELDAKRASGGAPPIGMPLMVLVDETTTGASEIFAAVASDSVRGVLTIGRPTAGDPGIRDGIQLPDGHVLYIAVRRIVTGNGFVMDGRAGAPPNVRVLPQPTRPDYEPDDAPDDRRARLAEETQDRELRDRVRGDPVLQRALDVVLGLKALNIRAQ